MTGGPGVRQDAECGTTAGYNHWLGKWYVVVGGGTTCCGTECDFNYDPAQEGCMP